MADGAYGRRLGEFVGVKAPPTVNLQLFRSAPFAVTRVGWEQRADGYNARMAREDAYLLGLQLRDVPVHPYWVDGRPVTIPPIRAGQFTLLNLNLEHASYLVDPLDCLAIYISRAAFDAFADEYNAPRIQTLHIPPACPLDDIAIRGLGTSLLPAISNSKDTNRLFLDSIALAVLTHVAGTYGDILVARHSRPGGLATWQERRAKETLNAHIDGNISLEQLAATVGLSRGHFARAFKQSTGMPPHRWLLTRRVERAEALLLNSTLSIDEISARCGFADQSHFTRVFSRLRGAPPGEWRRQRRT